MRLCVCVCVSACKWSMHNQPVCLVAEAWVSRDERRQASTKIWKLTSLLLRICVIVRLMGRAYKVFHSFWVRKRGKRSGLSMTGRFSSRALAPIQSRHQKASFFSIEHFPNIYIHSFAIKIPTIFSCRGLTGAKKREQNRPVPSSKVWNISHCPRFSLFESAYSTPIDSSYHPPLHFDYLISYFSEKIPVVDRQNWWWCTYTLPLVTATKSYRYKHRGSESQR